MNLERILIAVICPLKRIREISVFKNSKVCVCARIENLLENQESLVNEASGWIADQATRYPFFGNPCVFTKSFS